MPQQFHKFFNQNFVHNFSHEMKVVNIQIFIFIFSRNHIYEKNLLLNVSGELTSADELIAQENRTLDVEHLMSPWPIYPFWKIWSSAGQGWKVVQGNDFPVNSQVFVLYPKVKPPPLDYFTHCFFTSYHSCSKEQTIDFALKCKKDFLLQKQRFQVQVKISQWYCFKGPCTLDLKVTFLDDKKQPIQDVVTYRSPSKELLYHWNYLEMDTQLSFHNVRYIKFYHGSTCNENIEDEVEQKVVGTYLAHANVSISFPFEDNSKSPLFVAKVE